MSNQNMAMATVQTTTAATWDQEQIDTIKRLIAPNIPDAQLALFGMVCKRTGLDPFSHQIYCIPRGGKWTIQTGIDGYRLAAARSGVYAGVDDAVYDSETADIPQWASVTVYRMVQGQRCPFTAKARWKEYCPAAGSDSMWRKFPYLMLGKVAESLALRKAFPAELSGVYTGAEMDQAGTTDQPAWATVEQIQGIKKACELLQVAAPADEELADLTTADADGIIANYRREYRNRRVAATIVTDEAEVPA